MNGPALVTALVLTGVMSLVTFVTFAWDKRSARAGTRRVRERTLLLLALAGGWPGAVVAIPLLRHKTRTWSILAPLIAIVAMHAAAWLWILAG